MARKRKPVSSKAPNPGPTGAPDRESLDSRLAAARQAAEPAKPRGQLERGAFGVATRLVAELVSGLVIGGGIGWGLDRWLNTAPWFLVVFFVLGAAAGIINVFRAAKEISGAEQAKTYSDRQKK